MKTQEEKSALKAEREMQPPEKIIKPKDPKETKKNDGQLVRGLSLLGMWAFAFGCVIGWSAFVMPGTDFLPSAGPFGVIISMEIVVLVMLVISYGYSYMIEKFPFAGGEFIYAKEAFNKHHGFICAWFLSLSYMSVIPLNATALNLIMRALFGSFFQRGLMYSVAGYDVYAGEIALALCSLALFGYISTQGIKLTSKIQVLMVAFLLGGIAVILIGSIFSPASSSENLRPMFLPSSIETSKTIGAQILAVAVAGPQSFVGFDIVPQLTEEADIEPKRVKIVMDTTIICGGFVYIALTLIACSAFPGIYASWPEYISAIRNLEGYRGIATLNSAYTIMGMTGLCVITVSVLAAILTGILGFFTATSRLIYSMSRDGLIPNWFSKINAKGVPVNAVYFCAIVSGLICLLGRAVMGWVFDMASIGGSIGFAYTSLSACKYAISDKRKDIMIFGALGFIFSVMFAFFLLVPIPGLNISLGKEAYVLLFIWIFLGLIFYFVSHEFKTQIRDI